MLTMVPPPRSSIDGSAARQVWNAAVRSVRRTSSQSAGSISRNGPTWVRPALLTRASTRPNRSMTARTSPSAWAPSARSAPNASATAPAAARAVQRVRAPRPADRW